MAIRNYSRLRAGGNGRVRRSRTPQAPNRYATMLTREQQQRRNQTPSARRANSQFRTAADSNRGVSYAKAQPKAPRSWNNPMTRAMGAPRQLTEAGRERRRRYQQIRAAFGLSAG
ncbi:MAG: hypothetical protein J6T22_09190 [Bacteroidales bacterium]|nr:hypothetical protein [Bacteroidales bacterium]MBO7617367.1 hypothetical protein [Bacteroidales bacterium]